jgi:hypothetical protein
LGNASIPLEEIEDVDYGESHLPSRQGMPFLGRFLPGVPHHGDTLLLHTASLGGVTQLAVIAGLPHDKFWGHNIDNTIKAIPERKESQRKRSSTSKEIEEKRRDIESRISANNGLLLKLTDEISNYERENQKIEHELSLPDWETRTLHLKGRNLPGQLDRELSFLSRENWELVSTSSPRKDELIVSLKRVRRI